MVYKGFFFLFNLASSLGIRAKVLKRCLARRMGQTPYTAVHSLSCSLDHETPIQQPLPSGHRHLWAQLHPGEGILLPSCLKYLEPFRISLLLFLSRYSVLEDPNRSFKWHCPPGRGPPCRAAEGQAFGKKTGPCR